MKKLFPFVLFLIMIIPGVASAHAELETSQPQEGETVNQSIDTLNLQFGEDVEKFISFTITNEKGETIPADDPSISGKSVLVLTKNPLPSGDYTAKWELVAKDGHDNKGQLTFKVEKSGDKNVEKAKTPVKSDPSKSALTQEQSPGHQAIYISIMVVLVVIILIGVMVAFRKNRK